MTGPKPTKQASTSSFGTYRYRLLYEFRHSAGHASIAPTMLTALLATTACDRNWNQ